MSPLLALNRHSLVRCTCPLSGAKQTLDSRGCPVSWSLSGVKRTCVAALHESAFDPKRTSAFLRRLLRAIVPEALLLARVCVVPTVGRTGRRAGPRCGGRRGNEP